MLQNDPEARERYEFNMECYKRYKKSLQNANAASNVLWGTIGFVVGWTLAFLITFLQLNFPK